MADHIHKLSYARRTDTSHIILKKNIKVIHINILSRLHKKITYDNFLERGGSLQEKREEQTKIEEPENIVDPDIDDEHNLIGFWLNPEPKPEVKK